MPTQAEFLARVIATDQNIESAGGEPPAARRQATNTSLAAVADALHEQGQFDLLALAELCSLPTDAAGLCAIAAALDIQSGVGASRGARLAALRAMCTETMSAAMVLTVPEYGQTVADLATHLEPLGREHEESILLWNVLIATEKTAAERSQEFTDVARENLQAVTRYCVLSYQNCEWDQQTRLRNSYYCASQQVGSNTPKRGFIVDPGGLLLFGAPGLDSIAAASLQRTTENTLVGVFNKLTAVSASDDPTLQNATLWSQVGRLALVSPTLLLRKVVPAPYSIHTEDFYVEFARRYLCTRCLYTVRNR